MSSRRSKPNVFEESKKLASRKYCLHPEAGTSCKGKIVRAHTVPKSGTLRKIARDGHVYGFGADFGSLHKHKGELVPELIGVSDASTFTGFCSHHDDRAFAPLEKVPFEATAEQVFLLTYRSVCREVYGSRMAVASVPLLMELADAVQTPSGRRYESQRSSRACSTR